MQKNIEKLKNFEWFQGDKILWGVIIIISLFSLAPVYSASTNLQYVVNEGTTAMHLIKHAFLVFGGWALMRGIVVIKYEQIMLINLIALPLSIGLLVWALLSGRSIDGASASRWVNFFGVSFQPSILAYFSLIIHICWYLTRKMKKDSSWWEFFFYLFLPIGVVIGLVFKDNGSMGVIIFFVSIIVMILGQFPIKYIGVFGMVMGVLGVVFIYLALNTKIFENTRVNTWVSRVEVFLGTKKDIDEEALKAKTYQVDRAKAAIYHGGLKGVGPGKSALVSSLPQSVSDFIFAIIIEEYGVIGAFVLLFLYFVMLIRMLIIANKTSSLLGTLLVLAVGVMISAQLVLNIAVAVNLIPVTGQSLPLISYGGTSMLVIYGQLGLVLNISSRIQVLDEEGIGRKQNIQGVSDIA